MLHATARVPGKVRAAQAATSSAVASGPSSRAPCSASARSSSVAAAGGAAVAVVVVRSSELLLVDAVGPAGERLAGLALVEPAAHEALDEVGQVGGGDLQAAHGAAQAGLVAVGGGEATAEVHLEARAPARRRW